MEGRPVRFADGLEIACKRKRGMKSDPWVQGLGG